MRLLFLVFLFCITISACGAAQETGQETAREIGAAGRDGGPGRVPIPLDRTILSVKTVQALGLTREDPDYERALYEAALVLLNEEKRLTYNSAERTIRSYTDPNSYRSFRSTQITKFRVRKDEALIAAFPEEPPQTIVFRPVSYEALVERGDADLLRQFFDVYFGRSQDLSFVREVLGAPASDNELRLTALTIFRDVSAVEDADKPFFQKEKIALIEQLFADVARHAGERFYGYQVVDFDVDPLQGTLFAEEPLDLNMLEGEAYDDERPEQCCLTILPASLKNHDHLYWSVPDGELEPRFPQTVELDENTMFFVYHGGTKRRDGYVTGEDGTVRLNDRPGHVEAVSSAPGSRPVLSYLREALVYADSGFGYHDWDVLYETDRALSLEGYTFSEEELRRFSQAAGSSGRAFVRTEYRLRDIAHARRFEEDEGQANQRLDPAIVYRTAVSDLSLVRDKSEDPEAMLLNLDLSRLVDEPAGEED